MEKFRLIGFVVIYFLLGFCLPVWGQDVTRYRGVMISPRVQQDDLQVLANWRVNFIRWQLNWTNIPANASLADYDAWLQNALSSLDTLLPVCEKNGIKVLVDLHTTPGNRNAAGETLILKDSIYQAKFIDVWKEISTRYSGNKTVWGYDLANEPAALSIPSGVMSWHQLATMAAQTIRAVDKSHTIVVEADQGGNPYGFNNFAPLASSISNVVYSFHMYLPHNFTLQGTGIKKSKLRYPGVIDGQMWNRAQLRRSLQPVINFQKKYGVGILVGEFSAVRWAHSGSAFNYLQDVIPVFEENGWDWTYHAFRESNMWSVEHVEDRNNNKPATKQTNREKLLRTWFSKNQK